MTEKFLHLTVCRDFIHRACEIHVVHYSSFSYSPESSLYLPSEFSVLPFRWQKPIHYDPGMAEPGGLGEGVHARAIPSDFGRLVNPILIRGAYYVHQINYYLPPHPPPPAFKTFCQPWCVGGGDWKFNFHTFHILSCIGQNKSTIYAAYMFGKNKIIVCLM